MASATSRCIITCFVWFVSSTSAAGDSDAAGFSQRSFDNLGGVTAATRGPVDEFDGYYADWSTGIGSRPTQPTCVNIPKNMSLCHNIGYHKMRLPNLLDHDTLAEALQQSNSWIPLLNIKCHPDTQLFLCSLFSPVCLDRPIYPCRSLCDKVKLGCENRMRNYGFPWPDMLRCEKFPIDNDMCITAQSSSNVDQASKKDADACSACHQAVTYENILDNFCRADFAVKTKIRKVKKSRLICRKSKVFKAGGNLDKKDVRTVRRPKFVLDNLSECCEDVGKKIRSHYLIMGQKHGIQLVPTFIMEWSKDSMAFKKAVKRFKNLDCSNPKIVSESMVVDGAMKVDSPFAAKPSSSSSSGGNVFDALSVTGGGSGRRARKVAGGSKTKDENLFEPSTANITIVGYNKPPGIPVS